MKFDISFILYEVEGFNSQCLVIVLYFISFAIVFIILDIPVFMLMTFIIIYVHFWVIFFRYLHL